MYLIQLDGYYKGVLREFDEPTGRALLASGRAKDPFVTRESSSGASAVMEATRPAKPAKKRSAR